MAVVNVALGKNKNYMWLRPLAIYIRTVMEYNSTAQLEGPPSMPLFSSSAQTDRGGGPCLIASWNMWSNRHFLFIYLLPFG